MAKSPSFSTWGSPGRLGCLRNALTSVGNFITFEGFNGGDVTIQIGTDVIGVDEYAKLSACGAFLGNSAGKIYEDPGNPSGVIASF